METKVLSKKYVDENYVHKDKIREMINDYTEKLKTPLINTQTIRELNNGILVLSKLLEKG